MSMDLDKNDLSELCAGLTTDEVDRVHRLLHEWNGGPDSSFPVQLALLTNAQWRIAANLPRLMNDARKLIELHLAEYRRQSQAMADNFADTVDGQNKEFKKTVEIHIQATRQAAGAAGTARWAAGRPRARPAARAPAARARRRLAARRARAYCWGAGVASFQNDCMMACCCEVVSVSC